MFIESSSFAASAIVGSLVIKGGLTLLMIATPVGWVGLIIAGLAVAGAGAAASIGTNHYAKKYNGKIYDDIMKWLSTL